MVGAARLVLDEAEPEPDWQRAGPLGGIVAALEALGAEVWEPFARNNQIDRARPGWAYEIGSQGFRCCETVLQSHLEAAWFSRIGTHAAQSADNTSACSSTVRVAFSCLSGG